MARWKRVGLQVLHYFDQGRNDTFALVLAGFVDHRGHTADDRRTLSRVFGERTAGQFEHVRRDALNELTVKVDRLAGARARFGEHVDDTSTEPMKETADEAHVAHPITVGGDQIHGTDVLVHALVFGHHFFGATLGSIFEHLIGFGGADVLQLTGQSSHNQTNDLLAERVQASFRVVSHALFVLFRASL